MSEARKKEVKTKAKILSSEFRFFQKYRNLGMINRVIFLMAEYNNTRKT